MSRSQPRWAGGGNGTVEEAVGVTMREGPRGVGARRRHAEKEPEKEEGRSGGEATTQGAVAVGGERCSRAGTEKNEAEGRAAGNRGDFPTARTRPLRLLRVNVTGKTMYSSQSTR